MFSFLCSRVLDDGTQEIHELEVGHKVFGRPAQYDTTADNIVRVHASMLRKRLSEFFDTDGRHESFTIEIPRGNYAPLFIERTASPKHHAEIEAPSVEPLSLSDALSPESAPLPDIVPPPAPSRLSAWAFGIVSCLAIFFCGLSIYLLFSVNSLRHSSHRAMVTDQPTVRQFWTRIFPETGPAELVLDDASLSFYEQATKHPIALVEYFDRSYLDSAEKSAAASKLDPGIIHSLMLRRESSFSASALTWKMAQIADELHGSANVQFARDLTFRQAKVENLILLGTPQSNPWIQPFEPHLSLMWVPDPVLHSYYPRDKTAPEAVQDQYRISPADKTSHDIGFATISFLPNLSGNRNVLILSATGGSTMATALNFLSDEASMSQLRSRIPPSHASGYPYFEVLLKTEKSSKELNAVKIVICRSIAAPAAPNS